MHFGGDRDLYETMGYPRVLTVEKMTDAYKRQDIAGRIVDAFPDATWREPPLIKGEDAFVSAWEKLDKDRQVLAAFHRLDRLVGLGHYGVLFLGLSGGEDPSQPVGQGDRDLLFVQPHGERTAQVAEWEDDITSPRYGLPKKYNITTGVNWIGSGSGRTMLSVHHSRVIHVAERSLEHASIGIPRLERVFNRLMDLDKMVGGNAEVWWQNSAMLLAFLADADVDFDPDEASTMADQLEELQHGLRRMLRLRGVTPQQLAPGMQGSDSSAAVDKLLDLIAGAVGMPKRILIGSERGELSSAQDENNWAARIKERREQFTTPCIIEPFFNKGQAIGFLPRGSFEVDWPAVDTLGDEGRARVADIQASAIQKYVNSPGAEYIIGPAKFATDVMGFDEPEPIELEEPLPEDVEGDAFDAEEDDGV
jgi:hypothetical protein